MKRFLKNLARRGLDRLQCHPIPGQQMLGTGGSAWCAIPSLFGNRKPILFSGGAGKDISFELDFARKFGGAVHLYDPSPTGRETIERITDLPTTLVFYPKALTGQGGAVEFARPQNPLEGSWTATRGDAADSDEFESVSLASEMARLGFSRVDVVKLDIEGFEYEVLDGLLDSPSLSIGQILVEFHDFFPSIPRARTSAMRQKLKRSGYRCFFKKRYDFSFVHLDWMDEQ